MQHGYMCLQCRFIDNLPEGLVMFSTIAKWGNSAALRIPSTVLADVGLKAGDSIDMVVNPDHTITLKPVRKPKPRLADLLAAITPDNLPDDQDDAPRGSEQW